MKKYLNFNNDFNNMSFKIEIHVDELKELEMISKVIEEGIFVLDKEGLHFKNTDRAMVCYVEWNIPAEKFSILDVKKKVKLGINLETFWKIIKKLGTNMVTIEGNEKMIEIKDRDGKFTIPLLDIEEESLPDVNQLNFDISFDVLLTKWRKLIDNATLLGAESVTLVADESGLKAYANGFDLQNMKFEMVLSNELTDKKAKSKYAVEYLKAFRFRMTRVIDDKLKISFSKDYPLLIEKDNFKVILAPRVEE